MRTKNKKSKKLSFPKEKMRITLLESIHPAAEEQFRTAGYSVQRYAQAFSEKELLKIISGTHLLGIRSKTKISKKVLDSAKNLLAVGCFCIGTDQVDLRSAASHGVPVFNAPFSNTRSVAELAMAEIVMLARGAAHKSNLMHRGIWEKSAEGSNEVRGKKLGIVGYGHIGPQLGLLAEAFGMRVLFYDIVGKLPLGNAQTVGSLKELLPKVDFLSLHVPETPATKNLIGAPELAVMKKGSFLLNLSRGSVVDINAAKKALVSGRLAGAAFDVFPIEPDSNKEPFSSPLRGLDNVILTPHVGGSTIEAQHNIGVEVASSLIKFTDMGSSSGAVNFPQIDLPIVGDSHRMLNVHKNVPGVLSSINSIIADVGANIHSQYLSTREEIGYLIMDINKELSIEVKKKIDKLETNIRTRLLF